MGFYKKSAQAYAKSLEYEENSKIREDMQKVLNVKEEMERKAE